MNDALFNAITEIDQLKEQNAALLEALVDLTQLLDTSQIEVWKWGPNGLAAMNKAAKAIRKATAQRRTPMNDGSEAQELHQSNVFEIGQLQGALRRAKAQAGDGYKQSGSANALLVKCRNLLELVMCDDKQLERDCQEIVFEIDEFYPQE